MWMWPLDSAMGAIAAHRVPERVADRTCTWIWVWMTDKCRRRMNEREGYITTKITQSRRGKEEEGPEKKERLLGCERSWEFLSSGDGSFVLGTLDHLILCIFYPQNKPSPHQSPTFGPILYKFIIMGLVRKSSKPNFWTHSLQIHYNGPGPKIETLQLAPSVGKVARAVMSAIAC